MELISNTSKRTHAEEIAELVRGAEELVFVSPFLFDDFTNWVTSLDLRELRKFVLVTTLAPKGDDQLRKPVALLSLYEVISTQWPSVELVIQINNKLHGKIYLFKRNGVYTKGIVTSANLTNSGLKANHEWGIKFDDNALLNKLHQEIVDTVEYPYIAPDLLRKLVLFADQFKRNNPGVGKQVDIDASLLNALKMAPKSSALSENIDWDNVRNVFLKPWGTKDQPVFKEDKETFGEQTGVLLFPKGKPNDVGIDDIVITFGTGSRCILSVYKVLSYPEERPKELQERDENARRWPWYVYGHNYTTNFGDSWWEHDITIDALLEEYQGDNREKKITEAGGNTLGAFQFGAGRLLITKEFGKYIVERVMRIEDKVSTVQLV